MKADQEKLKTLLTDTVTLLCKKGLVYTEGVQIEGLFGVTVDNKDAFFIHISEKIEGCNGQQESDGQGGNAAEALSILAAKASTKDFWHKSKNHNVASEAKRHRNSTSPKSTPSRPSSRSSAQASPAHHRERRPSSGASPSMSATNAAVRTANDTMTHDSEKTPTGQQSHPGQHRVPPPHGPGGPDFGSMDIPADLQNIQGQYPFGNTQNNTHSNAHGEPPLKRQAIETQDNGKEPFTGQPDSQNSSAPWLDPSPSALSGGNPWPSSGGHHMQQAAAAQSQADMVHDGVTGNRGMDADLQPGNFMDFLMRDPEAPPVESPRYPIYGQQGGAPSISPYHQVAPSHMQAGAPPQPLSSPMKSSMKPMPPGYLHSPMKHPDMLHTQLGSPMQQALSMPTQMQHNNLPSMQQLANSVRHPNHSPLPPLTATGMLPDGLGGMTLGGREPPTAAASQSPNLPLHNSSPDGIAPGQSPMPTGGGGGSFEDSNSPQFYSDASQSPNMISIHQQQQPGVMMDSEQNAKKAKAGKSPKQMGRPPKQRSPRAKQGDSPDGLERLFTCKVPGCGKTFTLDTNARRHERLAHKYFRGKNYPEETGAK